MAFCCCYKTISNQLAKIVYWTYIELLATILLLIDLEACLDKYDQTELYNDTISNNYYN